MCFNFPCTVIHVFYTLAKQRYQHGLCFKCKKMKLENVRLSRIRTAQEKMLGACNKC